MPHSVSPEATTPTEDSILPDAPAEPLPEQGDSEDDTEANAGVDLHGGKVVDSVSHARTDEVRLEDLFDDDEDDDEFPSSGATDVKMASSPPQQQPM